jgi:tRNA pseudouridine55 synthase
VITPGRTPPRPLALPLGLISQRPPAYSAVKVGGERAYRLARRGVAVELAPRDVEIHEAVELWREGERAALRITCSSGTYVRSLVADLGDAYCMELRRTAIGPFLAQGAWPTEGPATITELATAWRSIGGATAELSADQARRAANGRPIEGVAAPERAPLPLLLLDAADAPVALAERRDDGTLAPIVGLRGAPGPAGPG